MPMAADDIARLIKERFPDAEIRIEDLAGDGDHYAATIVSEAFRGKTPRAAAPDGLRCAQGKYGRGAARPCAEDGGALATRETTRKDRT